MTTTSQRLLRRVGTALVVVGGVWLAAAMWTEGFRHRAPGWAREATRPRWVTYREGTGAFQIQHRSNWQKIEPVARYTKKRVGPVSATDRVAFRYHDPFAFALVVRYEGEKERTPEEWIDLVERTPKIAAEFGEVSQKRRRVLLPDRTKALEVRAEGPLRGKSLRFQSIFVPRGRHAYRLTVGADSGEWRRVEDQLSLMLASFRVSSGAEVPPKRP